MTTQEYSGISNNGLDCLPLDASHDDAPVFTKAAAAAFTLVVGLFVAARLWHITAYSLWSDAVFSVETARLNWDGLINSVVKDVVHPPLFYLLLKLWIGIGGESLLWLTLFPVLTSIAAIIPFVLLCRELKLRASEINLALLLMAVNGYMIFYAQEIRMYSLLLMLTICSLWLFVRFFKAEIKGRGPLLVGLFAVNLLLVYTQYHGWLVVGIEWIILLIWGRAKLLPFSVSVALLMLCFSPWVYAVTQAAINKGGMSANLDWIGKPQLSDLVLYYSSFNGSLNFRGSTLLRLLFFGFPILWWTWHVIKRTPDKDKERAITFRWLALFSFLPVALTFFVSWMLPHSVWGLRFLIITVVPYMILVASALLQLRPSWFRTAAVLVVVGWAAISGFKELNHPLKFSWEALVRQMIQAEPLPTEGIKVYVFQNGVADGINFYLQSANERRFQIINVDDDAEVDGDRLWIGGYKDGDWPDRRIWLDMGYQVGTGFKDGNGAFLFPVWRR